MMYTDASTHASFSAAISACAAEGRPLFVAGDVLVPETAELPAQHGYMIQGSGSRFSINPNHPVAGPAAALVWTGGYGGTVLRLSGANATISDLGIYGHTWDRDHYRDGRHHPESAAIGLHITNSGNKAIGPGRHKLHNMVFDDLIEGVRVGDDRDTPNCDMTCFTGLTTFRRCVNGLHVLNKMGMGFAFDQVIGMEVENLFAFDTGGGLSVANTSIVSAETVALLRLIQPEANGSTYRFGVVKRDADAHRCRFVQMDKQGVAFIQIDQCHTYINAHRKGTYDPIEFDLKGAGHLTLGGHNRLGPGSIRMTRPLQDEHNTAIINNSRLLVDHPAQLLAADCERPYTLMTRCCYDAEGRPMDDFALSA